MANLRLLSPFFLVLLVHLDPLMAIEVPSAPFPMSLEVLQNEIGYQFKSPHLLLQAMTHSSFSLDNNHVLSLLGLNAMQAAAALSLISIDVNTSPSTYSARIARVSAFDNCVAFGKRIGIQSLVRVARNTRPDSPNVICGAYRAMYGAVAVDAGGLDVAAEVMWRVLDAGIRTV